MSTGNSEQSTNSSRPCYICDPKYLANCTTSNGVIPICSVCAWSYRITTDEERLRMQQYATTAEPKTPLSNPEYPDFQLVGEPF